MKWLYKLEYKFGRYYIRNLMTVIVGGMVLVYLLNMFFAPSGVLLSNLLTLDRAAILRGQVWRLVTFLFVPEGNSILLIINLYFYYMMGRYLEQYWGGFKLNVYYLCGVLGAIAACFVSGVGTNVYLNMSLILAFATIAPDTQFLLLFIIPVKAKWLAIAYGVMFLIPLLQVFIFISPALGLRQLVSLAFSLVNYLLFFGPTLIGGIRDGVRVARNRRNWQNQNRNNRWN